MKAEIGITDENRSSSAHKLAKILADEFVLTTKTRGAHWNIEGSDFHSKHLFFRKIAKVLHK